jgi:hypothetical protein
MGAGAALGRVGFRGPVESQHIKLFDQHRRTKKIKRIWTMSALQTAAQTKLMYPVSKLSPNKADIAAHLYALFSPTFVNRFPGASIEIAYGYAAAGNAVNKARHFSAFDLKGAAEFARQKMRLGSMSMSVPRCGKANSRETAGPRTKMF